MEKPSNTAKSLARNPAELYTSVGIGRRPHILVGDQTICSGRTIEDRVVNKIQIGNQASQSCSRVLKHYDLLATYRRPVWLSPFSRYDATNEIEDVANALLNADTSVSTTPDGESIVGRLNRIWNVIYRHSRFYRYGADGHGGDSHASDGHGGDAGVEAGVGAVGGAAGQADNEMDSQLARFNALEEYLEHPEMDIDERIKGVFGV